MPSIRLQGWLLLFATIVMAAAPSATARDLAVPVGDLLPSELVGIHALPGEMAVLLLRSSDGRSELPIFTGQVEAAAIERAWRRLRPDRPLTHELLGDLLEATGWKVERLVIDELRDGQFLAALELRNGAGQTRLVDTRPSDGLALALRAGAPVVIARQVYEAARVDTDDTRLPAPLVAARERLLPGLAEG